VRSSLQRLDDQAVRQRTQFCFSLLFAIAVLPPLVKFVTC
jgi:hypothetical protein